MLALELSLIDKFIDLNPKLPVHFNLLCKLLLKLLTALEQCLVHVS